ncbi:hypothetical protein HDG42_005663 [Paraburkholderia sp. JPY171]|nr:hypothetical protein [Paraburkholderia atlantica]
MPSCERAQADIVVCGWAAAASGDAMCARICITVAELTIATAARNLMLPDFFIVIPLSL